MELRAAFRLDNLPQLALVGAGGKSSALFWLGRELAQTSRSVILTTTTHLGAWQVSAGDRHVVIHEESDIDQIGEFLVGLLVVTGERQDKQRYGGLSNKAMEKLHKLVQEQIVPLLIEADGARMLPLKAPAEHEPAIPQFVGSVVVCAGIRGVGKPLTDEWVQRPEIFGNLAGLREGELVTPDALSRVLMHPQGGLKHIPPSTRRILLLNQIDSPEKQAQAREIAQEVQQVYHGVVIAMLPRLSIDPKMAEISTQQTAEIHSVHEAIAGVVLAAGESKRFGSLKQLIEWEGQPMVCRATQTALMAGLSPVVVVTGAGAELVSQALTGYPVRIVYNPHWQSGQSSSLQAGLAAIPPSNGGAVFLLADQPNIPEGLIKGLIEAHSQSLAPIVAPLVGKQRGNPVLFDQVTFKDLMKIRGDVGGRAIFSIYPVRYFPWHDPRVLLDLDQPDDYDPQRAKKR